MTVATRHFKEGSYGWLIFSLLRVDLFVFYGSTLFLQTCLFPLSVGGYIATLWFPIKNKNSNNNNNNITDNTVDKTGNDINTGTYVDRLTVNSATDMEKVRSRSTLTEHLIDTNVNSNM